MDLKYGSVASLAGNMPFGEKIMEEILKEDRRRRATIKLYYNATDNERQEWNNIYKNKCMSRKLIMSCDDDRVQKDMDKGVKLGNTEYPNELESLRH